VEERDLIAISNFISIGEIPNKRIINFVKADVSREEYFSRPIETDPLYLIDYKRCVKIVRALTEQLKNAVEAAFFVVRSCGLMVLRSRLYHRTD